MTSRTVDTKARLRTAALAVVRERGVGGASARAIAAAAEVNQALIFYHFGSVSELIEAASDEAVEARVRLYRDAFTGVDSLSDLLVVARQVHEQERQAGSMTVMAQIMAGAQSDPVLARAGRHALAAWTDEVDQVLPRSDLSSTARDWPTWSAPPSWGSSSTTAPIRNPPIWPSARSSASTTCFRPSKGWARPRSARCAWPLPM